ncbi:uncharacterized protein LOC135817798 [Sycon ciliatum]|uniref:uncharacterized protein LOC135817798 n=1 Tax=Sycon ciliatum TaxID=27933 RepID=UPI0031F5F6BD
MEHYKLLSVLLIIQVLLLAVDGASINNEMIDDCPTLPSIQNGKKTLSADQYQRKVIYTYRCNKGYILQGNNKLECLENGNWSKEPPTCEAKCGASLPADFLQQSQALSNNSNTTFQCGRSAADIIVVFDVSESMVDSRIDRLQMISESLETSLRERGFGLYPGIDNHYTLVSFGNRDGVPRVIRNNNNSLVYDIGGFKEASEQLLTRKEGNKEDGYHAIEFALENITDQSNKQLLRLNRSDIAIIVLLISDEDRDVMPGTNISRSDLKRKLRRNGVHMEVIVDNRIGLEGAYYGVDSSYRLYSSDLTVTNGNKSLANLRADVYKRTYKDYTSVALELGGAMWDWNYIFREENVNSSHVDAFVNYTVSSVEHKVHKCCSCSCVQGATHRALHCDVAKKESECKGLQCPLPPSIRNGFRTLSSTQYHREVIYTYRCNKGYILQGNNKLECLENGNWSKEPPTCEVKCGASLPADFLQQSQALSNNSNTTFQCGRSAADIIVVFDVSKSMSDSRLDRLQMISKSLETSLRERGFGLYPGIDNHYTLVSFGNRDGVPRVIRNNNNSLVYDIGGFKEASKKLLKIPGGSNEYGYHAIEFALEHITDQSNKQLLRLNRSDIAIIVLLISDEDRDVMPGTDISRSNLKRKLRRNGVHMEVIVDNRIGLEGAYGVDSSYRLYSSDLTVTNGNKSLANLRTDVYKRTYKDYTSVALELGGAMWDWNYIFREEKVNSSHVDAFVNYTVSSVEHKVHKCCSCSCVQGATHRALHCDVAKKESECKVPQCPPLPSIQNGVRTLSSTSYQREVIYTYRCNKGYILQGNNKLECLEHGNWSKEPPTCEVKCGASLPADFLQQSQALSNNSNTTFQCGRSAADIIVVFDVSKSMSDSRLDRLQMISESLETSLRERGFGLYPGIDNHYTLVSFGNRDGVPRVIRNNDNSLVYDIGGFKEASNKLLKIPGGSNEYGYHAIEFALENITDQSNKQLLRLNRSDIAIIVLLISDEDRDVMPGTNISRSDLKRKLRRNGVHMEVIVDNRIGLEGAYYGVDSSYRLYSSDLTVTNGNKSLANLRTDVYKRTYKDYTSVALELGGAMWDWNYIFREEKVNSSHVDAFVNYTVSSVEHKVHKCCSCSCVQGATHRALHCDVAKKESECKVPQCPPLPSIQNGVRTLSSTTYHREVIYTYRCNKGYILQGNNKLECLENGNWSKEPPTCEVKCGASLPADFPPQLQAMSNNSNTTFQCGRSAADIIVVFDESKSMSESRIDRLQMISESLETSLREHGFGLYPGIDNHYTLVSFGNKMRVPSVIRNDKNSLVYDIGGFKEASKKLLKKTDAHVEDGYNAIEFALENITDPGSNDQLLRLDRPDIAVIVLLISDEDRDVMPGTQISRSDLKRKLKRKGVLLEVIVDNKIGLEGAYYGVDSSYRLYSSDLTVTNGNKSLANLRAGVYRNTYKDYTSVALELGGAMWDWNYIFRKEKVNSSHVDAFVNYTVSSVEHKVHKCCSCSCVQGATHRALHCDVAKKESECKSKI